MEAFEEPQPTPARGTETDSNSAIRLTNSILGPKQQKNVAVSLEIEWFSECRLVLPKNTSDDKRLAETQAETAKAAQQCSQVQMPYSATSTCKVSKFCTTSTRDNNVTRCSSVP
ncbi:hypothetical protein CIB48_g2190 [Xylaria polymorpha]|nr:hypothetical protein CIB48_g2190 [Xylaria polymorpha]